MRRFLKTLACHADSRKLGRTICPLQRWTGRRLDAFWNAFPMHFGLAQREKGPRSRALPLRGCFGGARRTDPTRSMSKFSARLFGRPLESADSTSADTATRTQRAKRGGKRDVVLAFRLGSSVFEKPAKSPLFGPVFFGAGHVKSCIRPPHSKGGALAFSSFS